MRAAFLDLCARHAEPSRRYHTLAHLIEVFEVLDEFDADADGALAMATFYHDAVYDARSGTNEEDSAALWREFAGGVGGGEGEKAERVAGYILATKKHAVCEHPDLRLRLFVDADMAVLAKAPEAYDAYAGLIREEYKHIPRDVYCERRAEVLEGFLAGGRIYAREEIREECEGRARANLGREVEALRRGVIPGEVKGEGGGGGLGRWAVRAGVAALVVAACVGVARARRR